jgi:hypothetical protein
MRDEKWTNFGARPTSVRSERTNMIRNFQLGDLPPILGGK